MIKKYYWLDGFDGGNGSSPFNTEEEARAAAIEHVSGIRLTSRELELYRNKVENYVFVGYIDFSDDATQEDFDDKSGEFIEIDGIELNEKTLDRIY